MSTTQYTASIQKLYVAYFGRPADPLGLAFWEARVAAQNGSTKEISVDFAKTPEFTATYAGKSPVEIVAAIYTNLFGRVADTGGLLFWAGHYQAGNLTLATIIDAIAGAAVGSDVTILSNKATAATSFTEALDTAAEIIGYNTATAGMGKSFVAGVTDDATLATAIAPANLDAVTAAIVTASIPVVPAQNFILTSGSNLGTAFTGNTGDDTFDAGLSTGSLQTLNSGDNLNGGAGTDSLQAVVNSSVTPAGLTAIENVALTNVTTASTVDLTNATGIVNLINQASNVGLTVAGISKTVNVTVQDTTAAGQVVNYKDVTGAADAATVVLKNVSGAATLEVAGVETLTLNSSGSSSNVLATLTTADTTKLVVTGDKSLNVGTLGSSVVTVDASANTAGVTVVTGATNATTITGSAAADSLTLGSSTGNDVINAGAGNDTITFTANLTTGDTINGGDGTDTLRATAANLVTISAATPTTYAITNVETITATDSLAAAASLNAANISTTANRLNFTTTAAALTGATGTLTGNAGAFTVGLGGSTAGNTAALGAALTINDTGTATTDSLTLTNSAIDATTGLNINVYAASNLTVAGYETLTINTGSVGSSAAQTIGTITVTGDTGGTAAETVKFTGANTVSAGIITADIVDGSALTATTGTILTMVTGSTATTVTGSAGNDALFGNTATASSITGGTGNDTITGGSGNDTLLGGDGNDSIVAGGGVDSVDGGAGTDTITATLTAGNVITGGAGNDVLILGTAATASTSGGVSGFETLRASAAITQDMVLFLDNSTFTTLSNAAGAAVVFNNVGAGVTSVTSTVAAGTTTINHLLDTASNTLSATIVGNATTTALVANAVETLNLTSTSTAGAVTLTTLTSTDLHTLNINGSNAITIGTLSANSTTAGTLLTIDGSANTGGVTVSAALSTVIANIKGSATASNNLTGTDGADTIVGGTAADTIVGGVSSDTMTGGGGVDTFQFVTSATGTPSSTNFDVITDFGTTDIIDFTASAVTIAEANATATAGTAAISAAGRATFNIADTTLTQRLVAVAAGIEANTASAAYESVVFTVGADSYVFVSDGTAGLSATDVLVKLVGTDYSAITIVGGNITLA